MPERNTKILPIFNQAGGVGKTTVAHNLSYHLARRDNRVLVLDLDPQASLTAFMGVEPHKLAVEETLYHALMRSLAPVIKKDINGVDLVPTNIRLASIEQELSSELEREQRLSDVIGFVSKKYDFILIDSPPSLGISSTMALVAATHLLVPIQTQYKAFYGTDLLLNTVGKIQKRLNPKLKILGFLPTIHVAKNNHNREVLEAMEDQLSDIAPILPPIPICTALAEASEQAVPLALSSKAAQNRSVLKIFDQLAKTLEKL
ncbi:MAG TPA: AAA family ATPase [Stenomitos sp.]